MKIYFFGSIRGGRQDKDLYSQIILHLQQFGKVLTEHIGNTDLTDSGDSISFDVIYERDWVLLNQADVVVAEVT